MDLSPPQIGKREAEDAIEAEAASAKKQKVDENVSVINTDTVEVEEKDTSFEADTSCPKPEQWIEVEVSGVVGVGRVVSMLEDKSNALDASEKKPAVASKEGHIAAASEIDEPNDDADSCLHDETSLDEDFTASIEAPASLIKDPAAFPKKKDELSKGSDSSSEEAAVLVEDVTAANSSPPAPSAKKLLVSIQNIDDSRTHEHETDNDDNVDMAEKAPPGPTEKGPVVSWEKKDESCIENERPDKVTAECTSSVSTKKEDETNEELELDDETSSSDDDDRQTPATPTEPTSGSKTLFVGNLSFSVEQEDVEDFFKGAGEVVSIRFAMNSDETFKGYGYVEFDSAEAAKKAVQELNGKELLRRRVRLDFMKERGSFTSFTGRQDTGSFQNGGNAQGQTVFVRGFNKSDCQDEIRRSLEELFGSCGEISRVSIPKDQDGYARGIAYIVFKERDAFSRALALNGSEFKEGILSVKEARPIGDSRDGAGSVRGYGRNDGRYNSWEFGGRSGWSDFHGRSGPSNFRGRSGSSDFRGRSGPSDFCGRSSLSDFRGRSSLSDFYGRRGWSEFGRSGQSDFPRRGGRSDFPGRGGRCDFRGRGCQSDFHGRGDQSNFPRRGGWSDFQGRGDQSDFPRRGGWSEFHRRGGQSDYHGRSGWSDFRGRSGIRETGVWRGSDGRGVWRDFDGRGIQGKYSDVDGTTSVWFEGDGISSGQGTLIKPSIAAPAAAGGGNNTTFNNEGQLEDEMK